MTRTRLACLLTACALELSCGGGGDDKTADAGSTHDAGSAELDFSAFDAIMEGFVSDKGLAGATAVIVQRDQGAVHHKGYGKFDRDRLHLVASCSKVISVGVLMALADRGTLDLDAPLHGYVSDWGDHKPGLMLAQLLSNSSGLVGLFDDPFYAPYICQYTPGGKLQTCAKLIYTANDSAKLIAPDTMFKYGGGQWQLAGGLAEVVSGQSWADLVRETYADCDVSSLGFSNQFQQASNEGDSSFAYPAFFQADAANLPLSNNPNIEGGAYITSGDYGKLLLMHLRGGLCGEQRVLSEEAVARMQEDRIAKVYAGSTGREDLAGYGMGWWIDRDDKGVVVDPGLYGATAWLDTELGYGAFIAIEADEDTGKELFASARPVLRDLFADAK